uniref:Uncharacterized protein LOC102807688 n=1 Tax=Saccoglossus kowalevskii TaxID=10224 RepID=A0ABM0M6Z7_SACKO|nr:PREDICTED: uncharacterized protein LOC102807688 [Saccoglossus kowalevskii]
MPIYTVANSCKFTIFIALMVLGFFLYITLLSAVHTAFHDRQGDFGSRHEEWKHTLTWVEKRNSLPNYFLRPKLYASSSKKWPPNEKYRNGVMVFVHNAKTGGSSMRRCIRSLRETWNKTTPTRLYSAISGNLRTFYRNMLNSSKIDYKNDMYWGDMSMGVCDYIDKPCSYFAILRNPYERAVGTYIMCRQQQGRHRAHLCQLEHANNMTVKQWSIYQESQFFDQLLVNPEILADHPKFNDLFQGELSKKKYDRLLG